MSDNSETPWATSALLLPGKSSLGAVVFYSILMLTVGAIFGGYAVLTSTVFSASGTLSPLVFALARDAVGSVLLLSAAAIAEARAGARGRFVPAWADAGSIILLGVTGVWGAQGMSALAIKFTTATFFAATTNLQPCVTFALSLALGAEPWRGWRAATSWGKICGLATTVGCGAAIVISGATGGPDSLARGSVNFPLGAAYAGLQVLLGGSLAVIQKPLLARYSPLVLCGWGYGVGTVLLAMSVITGATSAADWDGVGSSRFLAAVAYAGALSSALAYTLMSVVNRGAGPTFVAVFMPSTVVFTIAFSFLFEAKAVSPAIIAPIAGLWAGIVLLVGSQHQEKIALAREVPAGAKVESEASEYSAELAGHSIGQPFLAN